MSDTPLRFGLVTTFYPPYNFGGDGITVRRLANGLAERGHHVEVIHCVDSYQMLRPRGTPAEAPYDDHPAIVHHGFRGRPRWLSPLITQQTGSPGLKRGRLRALLGGNRFDVVHFHNASLIGPTALAFANATTLYTLHEHWLVCPMHVLWRFDREPCPAPRCTACTLRAGRPPQWWRATGRLERALEHVDAFIAPSHFTREMHLARGLRVRAPIVHIPNFIPEPAEAPDSEPPFAEPHFLFAGRLERIKGAHILVEAFTRYRRAALVVAGGGHEAERLRALAGGAPHIRFLGTVPFPELVRLIRHAVGVIVPSVGYEVFPTVILEAFAQGTPVIGHRIGPIPEMLDERGGLTYADEDELVRHMDVLLQNPEQRADLGRLGRQTYLAEWTEARHFERYFSLIAELRQGAPVCV